MTRALSPCRTGSDAGTASPWEVPAVCGGSPRHTTGTAVPQEKGGGCGRTVLYWTNTVPSPSVNSAHKTLPLGLILAAGDARNPAADLRGRGVGAATVQS
jgi:hypothetical protein